MGDIIEDGYSALLDRINTSREKITTSREAILKEETLLIERMVSMTAPLVKDIGLSLLKRGKQDTKGGMYDTEYYRQKMIALGKTDTGDGPPDAMGRKVTDQFCVLGEDGVLYELIYTSDGFLITSTLHPLTPADTMATYGLEPVFMLYRAMKEYLRGQEDLVAALERTLQFLHPSP